MGNAVAFGIHNKYPNVKPTESTALDGDSGEPVIFYPDICGNPVTVGEAALQWTVIPGAPI